MTCCCVVDFVFREDSLCLKQYMLILLLCAWSYSQLLFAIQQFCWVLFMYEKEIVWVCHKGNS